MSDEQLIELVEQYPVLYDTSLALYRDHTVRNNAWEEIAKEMSTHVEEVKIKWGKLRNCFTNALKRRRKKSGQAVTYTVPWKFEKEMEFLLPYVEGRSTITNLIDYVTTNNDDNSTQDSEFQFSESVAVSPPTIRAPTPCTSSRTSAARASSPVRYKRTRAEMDENDYFFLSMSKQLRRLPEADQAEIKFQLHKPIHDSEMKMLNSREQIVDSPIKTETHY